MSVALLDVDEFKKFNDSHGATWPVTVHCRFLQDGSGNRSAAATSWRASGRRIRHRVSANGRGPGRSPGQRTAGGTGTDSHPGRWRITPPDGQRRNCELAGGRRHSFDEVLAEVPISDSTRRSDGGRNQVMGPRPTAARAAEASSQKFRQLACPTHTRRRFRRLPSDRQCRSLPRVASDRRHRPMRQIIGFGSGTQARHLREASDHFGRRWSSRRSRVPHESVSRRGVTLGSRAGAVQPGAD